MTTTTSSFQNKPDYYSSKEECEADTTWKKKTKEQQTNPQFDNFTQRIFHAGAEFQFQEYRDATNGDVCIPEIPLEGNLFANKPFQCWEGYRDLESTAIINTFRYMFNKFKKGIFVKIANNELRVFLPFSKANFINEWGDRIHIDRQYRTIEDFMRHITELDNINRSDEKKLKFNPKRINGSINHWYANNCLVRYEYPISESDTNVSTIKNMLEELCANRRVPDIEFFVNRRDFPVLTRNGSEPYYNIWDSMDHPLVSHAYDQYAPIFSMCVTNHYADLLIPTHEDWARVQSKENKLFQGPGGKCRLYDDVFDTPWHVKKPTAVFRGGTTGCGVTIDTNQRLKAAFISVNQEVSPNEHPYLDAGISGWNLRPRKIMGDPNLKTIEIDKLPFGLTGRLSPEEQSQFKYIINIDGHVTAFRLSLELSMGSVILLVGSSWKIWYMDMLEPYKHYVPVRKDLSDLIDQVKWCREHDEQCQQIALNAREFYDMYLQKRGIFDYIQKTLVNLKNKIGVYLYNNITPLEHQITQEYRELQSPWYPETNKTLQDITCIPFVMSRTFGLLQGLQWIVNMVNDRGEFEDYAIEEEQIFSNYLGTVRKFKLAKFSFVVKTTFDSNKKKEHIHEAYIGIKCINDLLKNIPNFAYTFGMYKQNNSINVITEHIHGETLKEYIEGPNFRFDEYLMILVQISLAIQVAQNSCAFVHYDLTPWNIILTRYNNSFSFDYVLGHDKILKVKSNIIPVIIDFGKSYVIHNNIHHGLVNMYHPSTGQDVFTLLIKSMYQILDKRQLSKGRDGELSALFDLAKYITGTGFRDKEFESVKDLKDFLKESGRYSNLISSNKYELAERTPYDFVKYIYQTFSHRYNMTFGNSPRLSGIKMNNGNGRQVFEYILSANALERAETYSNVFIRFKHCSIPQPDNLFFVYYAAQSLEENLSSVKDSMMKFLDKNHIDKTKYERIYNNTMNFLESVYRPQIDTKQEKDIEYILDSFSTLIPAPYNQETFLDPRRILDQIVPYQDNDLSEYKEIIEYILINQGKYKLNNKDREHYLRNFSRLLQTNSVVMKNNNANIKTLLETARVVYSTDLRQLEEKLQENVGQNCESVNRYIERYQDVLTRLL